MPPTPRSDTNFAFLETSIALNSTVSGLTHWTEGTDPSAVTNQSGSPLIRMRSPEEFDLLDNLGVGGGSSGGKADGAESVSASKSSSRGSKLDSWLSKDKESRRRKATKLDRNGSSKKSTNLDEYTNFGDNSCIERNKDRNWFWGPPLPQPTDMEGVPPPCTTSSSSQDGDWRHTASAGVSKLLQAVVARCHIFVDEQDYEEVIESCSHKLRTAIRISRAHCAAANCGGGSL